MGLLVFWICQARLPDTYQTVQMMHAFDIDEEATSIFVRPLHMSIRQPAVQTLLSGDNTGASCREKDISHRCEIVVEGIRSYN